MRLDVHAVNMDLTSEMEQHAKLRAWQAVQRWPQRAVWVGVWLTDQHNAAGGAAGASAPAEMDSTRYSCRFDVWLRGVGVISVCQSEAEARCAVDVASARLVQAISARMRKCIRDDVRFAPDEWRYTAPAGASGRLHCDEPASRRSRCLAVLIERKNSGRRSKMLQWLRDQYGVEQVIRLSLPAGLWRKAALGSSLAMNLRERLSLSMLCWPQLIVVAGRPVRPMGSSRNRLNVNRYSGLLDNCGCLPCRCRLSASGCNHREKCTKTRYFQNWFGRSHRPWQRADLPSLADNI